MPEPRTSDALRHAFAAVGEALTPAVKDGTPGPKYGQALIEAHDAARHQTYLRLLDGLHDRLTALEATTRRQDTANRIYAGIATSSTLTAFAALGIALNAWLAR